MLPLLLNSRARLIDNATLRSQLASLERRVGASDKESVTHPAVASAHDDVAAAMRRCFGCCHWFWFYFKL